MLENIAAEEEGGCEEKYCERLGKVIEFVWNAKSDVPTKEEIATEIADEVRRTIFHRMRVGTLSVFEEMGAIVRVRLDLKYLHLISRSV